MKVLILGIDGYLGWTLALHLIQRGHVIGGIDNCSRRTLVDEVDGQSIIPIADLSTRINQAAIHFERPISLVEGDLTDYKLVESVVATFKPDCIVHLGQMPSAPYSMKGVEQATWTHNNNVISTLNVLFAMKKKAKSCHLVKLGTMGEYGTPGVDIAEGFFPPYSEWHINDPDALDSKRIGRLDGMMFPRKAGSWYHLTKVHDTHNVEFACRNWGLRSTDIMQGVVYGTYAPCFKDLPPQFATRFDVDECFGTAINRFCAQAVSGLPITPYGKGEQRRGFLPLQDSMQCLTIAIEDPADKEEYRIWNQFEEVYSINYLAETVQRVTKDLTGQEPAVVNIPNPRNELEEHHYFPIHKELFDRGYTPTEDLKGQVKRILQDLIPHKNRIVDCKNSLIPKTKWK